MSADEGAFARSLGILDPENFHSLFRRIQVRLGLVAVRLSLLKIAFGDGMVLKQVLRAGVEFLRQAEGIRRLQIGVQKLRVIGAAHVEHWFACIDMLPGHYQNPAHRSANLSNHRRGVESVVRHGAGKPKRALQRGWLNRDDLHVRHLVLRNG